MHFYNCILSGLHDAQVLEKFLDRLLVKAPAKFRQFFGRAMNIDGEKGELFQLGSPLMKLFIEKVSWDVVVCLVKDLGLVPPHRNLVYILSSILVKFVRKEGPKPAKDSK